MQIFLQVVAAWITTMAVKNGKVACSYITVDSEILKNLESVLHPLSLPYIAKNPSVVTLYMELKSSDPKCVIWFKVVTLWWFKFSINTLTGFYVSV